MVNDRELRKFDPELQVSSVEASIGNLDVEQQKELQLYSLIDNQPFFKHYVQEVLRLNQDMGHSLNEKGIDIPLKMHYLDYFANDRPNIHLATQNRYQVKNSANHLRKDADGAEYVQAKGSRKTSRAVVRITPGSGKIVVNKRDFIEYFAATQRFKVCLPLTATMTACDFNIDIRTWGGGVSCQADACSVAISKALSYYDANYRPTLMKHGFLWVDYRQVERKKTGLYKARRKWTYKRR